MIKPSLNKISLIDYLFIIMLIIFAGSANSFTRSFETWDQILGLILPIALTSYLALTNKIKISKEFLYLIMGFLCYSLMLTYKFKELHPRFIGVYLISFYISYITISHFKAYFFILFHNLIYIFCVISLCFWVTQQILPNELNSIMQMLLHMDVEGLNIKSNVLIYTINSKEISDLTDTSFLGFSVTRNSGFTWEPGAFSVFINLAIFINLIINRFRLRGNLKLKVLIFTLITTFSTTGYAILILLMLFYAYNQKVKYRLILIPAGVITGIYLTSLSFMSDKIINISKQDTDQQIENSILYGGQYEPQRITSFFIDFQDFLNNPILGYGGHQEERWTNKLGAQIASISGIGKLLAKFGMVGTIFFFLMLIKSSKILTEIFAFKGWIFPFLIFLMIIFSYSIIEHPLMMCFWMLAFFLPKKRKIKHKEMLKGNS